MVENLLSIWGIEILNKFKVALGLNLRNANCEDIGGTKKLQTFTLFICVGVQATNFDVKQELVLIWNMFAMDTNIAMLMEEMKIQNFARIACKFNVFVPNIGENF